MNKWLSRTVKEIIVYRSLSHDVFVNLALEDWIFQHVDLTNKRILLLWRNKPCVVIGRHQNPWMETNINKLKDMNIKLARRRSGGGAVYHDLGNLNCTVFSNRLDYDRLRNLQLICDTINTKWRELKLYPTERGDILCGGKKVSGSAAKLSKDISYHHFTILLNVNTTHLKLLLQQDNNLIFSSSSATSSLPSPTVNLISISHDSHMTYNAVCTSIANQFYQVHEVNEEKIYDINPTCESTFPGITILQQNLKYDKWIYGKAPTFTVKHIKSHIRFDINKGIITNVSLQERSDLIGSTFNEFLIH